MSRAERTGSVTSGHRILSTDRDHPGSSPVFSESSGGQTSPGGGPDRADLDEDRWGVSVDPPIPAAIGKYRVVGRFPRSGQGQVFRVVHPELCRDLVLKLGMRPIDEEGRADVAEEGRRLAELEHPHIVRVHDLDFHEGRPFLVMEFIRGRTLAQYAQEERITPRRAASLVAEIAGAVDFAHRRGIVHQDIKPANVLIDEAGRPRLIDFGLARQQDAWSDSATRSEGGTFAYMAPEQARAESGRVRTLSDVFALGGLLYFLLTGKAPFEAATPQASWERARRCDLDPSAWNKAGIPRELERIGRKAMAADPRCRFATAEALRRALERYLRIRRAAPAFAAAAAGLALLIPAWAFWPRAERSSPDAPARPIAPGETAGRPPEPEPTVSAGPRIVRFEIPHFPKLDRDHDDANRTGLMGLSSFAAREEDDVIVRADLSEPAYSYLIAFRPDGSDELCDPESEDTPPIRKRQPSYPPPAKSDDRYRLNEGAGLYAFALVVSREPLPSYREWRRRVGPLPWAAKLPCQPGIVWRVDDGLPVLLADKAAGTRGKGAKARDCGDPAGNLARWLRSRPGIHAVMVEAFAVEPAAEL